MDQDDKLNLVRQIFSSPAFQNSTQERQEAIKKQVIETREVSEDDVQALYNQARASQLEKLPYGVFSNIILAGNIRGEDLLSLCNSSPILKEYCNRAIVLPTGQEVNQYLFRQLIDRERPGYVYQEEPREAYESLTTKRIKDFEDLLNFIKRVNDEKLIGNGETQIFYPNTIQALMYNMNNNQYGLLSTPSELYDPNFGRYNRTKAFLDNSFNLLYFTISKMNIANSYLVREGTFLAELVELFNRTGSFPEVLAYVKKVLNMSTEDLLKAYQRTVLKNARFSYEVEAAMVGTIFEIYPTIEHVSMLWDNYENYYLTCLTALIPKDNVTLENMLLARLLFIIDDYDDACKSLIKHLKEDVGEEISEAEIEISKHFTQIKTDLLTGAYHRVFKWLILLHRGVLNKKYSIFTPFIPSE